jgi:hypothetical protein
MYIFYKYHDLIGRELIPFAVNPAASLRLGVSCNRKLLTNLNPLLNVLFLIPHTINFGIFSTTKSCLVFCTLLSNTIYEGRRTDIYKGIVRRHFTDGEDGQK